MRLLKYEGYRLTFEPELLALKVFKDLYNKDRSRDKSNFLLNLAFIYFYCDARSDYQYIINPTDRMKAIIEGEGLGKDFKIDKTLQAAIDYYNSFKTTATLLLEDTRAMVDGYRKTLKEMTASMETMEVKDIKAIGDIIKLIPSMVKDLDAAEKAVTKELMQEDKIRGTAEKGMFEDLNFM